MTREALPEELVFHVARRIASPDARAAYILDACGNDLALRERVVALLSAHAAAGELLESPPSVVAVHPSTTASKPISERPGTTIGPTKLAHQTGQGGLGASKGAPPNGRKLAGIEPVPYADSLDALFEQLGCEIPATGESRAV